MEYKPRPAAASQAVAPGYMPSMHVALGTVIEQFDPWLEISAQNLAWNLAQVRALVGRTPIMAVVKCNAYGHGTVGIAQLLAQQGINQFAVVKVQEALALRANGVGGSILNFGPFALGEAELMVQHNITQSVFSDTVKTLADAARKLNTVAKVHIKVDTGLSRVGVPYAQALPYIESVATMPGISITGIFTTLTEEADFDSIQIARLNQVCEAAARQGIAVGLRHAASTSAIANSPAAYLDLVRPGNCLYGFEPQPNMDLRPVMALKTRVIFVKKVYPGDTLAYHRRFRITEERLLATLPVGYADGFPFQATPQAEVLIRGRRWPFVAAMSANHGIVDITGANDIDVGAEVVLFGSQAGATITLQELATWAESSVYKVATGMSPLLPRVYIE